MALQQKKEVGPNSDLTGNAEEIQRQLQQLQIVRAKAEEMSQERSRITGELGALQKQLQELETKCKTDFGCGLTELPEFIKQLKTEAARAKSNAEIILGLKESTVQKTPDAKPSPTKPVQTTPASIHSSHEDEDGLM